MLPNIVNFPEVIYGVAIFARQDIVRASHVFFFDGQWACDRTILICKCQSGHDAKIKKRAGFAYSFL